MPAQASSSHPETHDTTSIRARRPANFEKPAKVVSWRADIWGPGPELQPVDGHRNVQTQSSGSHLPWLRRGLKAPKSYEANRYYQPLPKTRSRLIDPPVLKSVTTALDSVGVLSDAPGKSKGNPGAYSSDHIVDIDRPHTNVVNTAIGIHAPSAQRPNYAAKLLQHGTKQDPAESLTQSLQQYQSLIDQVVSVADEAADYIIATNEYDRDLFSSPSSLDGADEEEFYDAPYTAEHDIDLERDGEPGPSQRYSRANVEGVSPVEIPTRHQSHEAMMSMQISPKTTHPEGAAETYYHPHMLPTAPTNAENPEGKKLLHR
jgi:hypothetical protein